MGKATKPLIYEFKDAESTYLPTNAPSNGFGSQTTLRTMRFTPLVERDRVMIYLIRRT